ncbi:MAG: FAD-binding oxidoreductase [Fimbriimonadaceae bacterium]
MAGSRMVSAALRPETIADTADAVRSAPRLFVVGADRHRAWRVDEPADSSVLDLSLLSGIVSIAPADQVVVVRAGTPLSHVQAALGAVNQTLPFAPFEAGDDPTIGGALSLALPHRLEGACGTWRDWTLGLTVVRPNGAVAKCGSAAVKNVAGYDVGRLFIGARGVLGVIAEVILKTFPLKALPNPTCVPSVASPGPRWVQRVPLGLGSQLRGPVVDVETATLWAPLAPDQMLPRFDDDWVIRSGCGRSNLSPVAHRDLFQRAKAIFDPTGKLNMGAFGE